MGLLSCFASCVGRGDESGETSSPQPHGGQGDQVTAAGGAGKANHGRRKSSHLSKYSTRSRHVVERPARIGAFNVRRFGKAKMRDAEVVRVLREIVRRYDVLLLQEVVDSSGEAVQELLEAVNTAEGEGEDAYGLEISPRLGRNKAKEQYAFLFRVVQLNLT